MKLKATAMILPWLLLFFLGMGLERWLNPTPRHPAYVMYRELLRRPESSGDLSSVAVVRLGEVREAGGALVMPGQPWTIVCPGDTVAIHLEVTANGHVASFSVTDPFTGEVLAVAHPTAKGSDVAPGATLSLHVPRDANASQPLLVPWSADTYIVRKAETTVGDNVVTRWFDLIKPVPLSGTLQLQLATPETRASWLSQGVNDLGPRFMKFLGVGTLLAALLVLVRKRFLSLLSALALFSGFALMFVLDMASRGSNGAGFFALSLLFLLAVAALAFVCVRRYHIRSVDALFATGD